MSERTASVAIMISTAGQRVNAVQAGDQLLCDHGQQTQGNLLPDLRLVGGRKHVQDARDGLNGVVGVQRGEHQVAGFGSGENRRDGFGIAHLAHQDHVRRLAHDAT